MTALDTPLRDSTGRPFELPDLSIQEIRAAIPKHCFEKSASKGFIYLARDLACLAATFLSFKFFVTPEHVPSAALRAALWTLYTFLQGLFGTGVWVIGHDCGHNTFSSSRLVNDAVGWVVHSFLLVPYFSWKISHGKHHKATGLIERDMVFVPSTRDEHALQMRRAIHELSELTSESLLHTTLQVIGRELCGFPIYLFTNRTSGTQSLGKAADGAGKETVTWPRKTVGLATNHFSPSSPLFKDHQAHLVILSDLGLLMTLGLLYMAVKASSLWDVTVWYIFPYLWVNSWFVALTYLHHTDPSLPHYTSDAWTFERGAAATIDLDFGFIGRYLFHSVDETHVLHHFVSDIPFYHAREASEAIKPVLGNHYRQSVGGSLKHMVKLWINTRWCQWVEPNEAARGKEAGVLFFRNRNGLGIPPAKMAPPGKAGQ